VAGLMGYDRGRAAGWSRLAPLYWLDPKIGEAGAVGESAFMRGMSWSKYYGQNGAINESALPMIGGGLDPEYRDACMDTKLWVPLPDGRFGIDLERWKRHQETEERRQQKADQRSDVNARYYQKHKEQKAAMQAEIDELRRKLDDDH
jgi:hypothetical protein